MTGRGWALVTGAARRIGRELALTAARAGYDVIVHYRRSPEDAGETVRLIAALGRQARAAAADLTDADACGRLIADGPGAVTLLVNCASLFDDDRIESLTAGGWDAALATNLRAPVLLAQAFAAA